MHALESLFADHRLIERMLFALENYGKALKANAVHSKQDLRRFARFFSGFADLGHYEKEESILFTAMTLAGFDWSTGLLAQVRQEHDHERYLIRVLEQEAAQSTPWDNEDRRKIFATIDELVHIQRRHIQREKTYLYPAALQKLLAEQLATVAEQLAEFDELHKDHEDLRLRRATHTLCERYLSDRDEPLEASRSDAARSH